MEEEKLNLYQKIHAVMVEAKPIEKDMTIGSGRYQYKGVSEAQVLNVIKPLFTKYKLIIIPIKSKAKEYERVWSEVYNDKESTKRRFMTQINMTYRLIDVESGEYIDVEASGNGADTQDKGSGKATTYAYKTVLTKIFMLFSGDDTEAFGSDELEEEQVEHHKEMEEFDKKVERGHKKGKKDFEDKHRKISTQQLVELAKENDLTKKQLILKYYKEHGEQVSRVSDIPQDVVNDFYVRIKEAGENSEDKEG